MRCTSNYGSMCHSFNEAATDNHWQPRAYAKCSLHALVVHNATGPLNRLVSQIIRPGKLTLSWGITPSSTVADL